MTHLLKRLAQMMRNWRPPDPGPDEDPYSGVREPRRGGPGGRALVTAVPEPNPEPNVRAVGRSGSR
jgi:hypothetical protein